MVKGNFGEITSLSLAKTVIEKSNRIKIANRDLILELKP
jgi:hypothetical protein